MSRTYKDKPWKYRDPENTANFGKHRVDYTYIYRVYCGNGKWSDETYESIGHTYLEAKGAKRKKKRHTDIERHWMTTPMWWIREMMTRPQRAAGSQWEKKVLRIHLDQLIEVDTPSVSRKPHIYYW